MMIRPSALAPFATRIDVLKWPDVSAGPDYSVGHETDPDRIFILGVTAWAAAQHDPVGHPAGYTSFEQVRSMDRPQEPSHGTVFVNSAAASIKKAGEPYPYGSVLIMEWRKGGKDGEVARLDVMRKERGYGAAYGADKNGDWEYASYSPDGKLITDATASLACAKCHLKAGASKDFVYIGRFAPPK